MFSKGTAYCELKEYLKAIDCFDKVLQIDPEDTGALKSKGTAYNNLKEY